MSVWCRTHSAASSAFTGRAKRAPPRVWCNTAWPLTWHNPFSLSLCLFFFFLPGVWMMSFLTLDVLVLQLATTTLPEVATRRRSTWTTGVCLCVWEPLIIHLVRLNVIKFVSSVCQRNYSLTVCFYCIGRVFVCKVGMRQQIFVQNCVCERSFVKCECLSSVLAKPNFIKKVKLICLPLSLIFIYFGFPALSLNFSCIMIVLFGVEQSLVQ